jgi:hypothetical protein
VSGYIVRARRTSYGRIVEKITNSSRKVGESHFKLNFEGWIVHQTRKLSCWGSNVLIREQMI